MFKIACFCPKRLKEFFVTGPIDGKENAIEELTYWREFQATGGFTYQLYELV